MARKLRVRAALKKPDDKPMLIMNKARIAQLDDARLAHLVAELERRLARLDTVCGHGLHARHAYGQLLEVALLELERRCAAA